MRRSCELKRRHNGVDRLVERYGDYELQRLIATGGMAEVYLATRSGAGGFSRTVVVKRMLPQLAVRPDFVQMFLDEARLAASLHHQNIVSVTDVGEVAKSYFIAMEFVDGPHLGSLFAHSLRLRKPLPIELCAYIIARSADGLHHAHEHRDPDTGDALHCVHRDVSPQNILISAQAHVKVMDFGVAKASTQTTKTRAGVIKGKVAYMSPEQCLGEVVDRRTDVFALGIVLYELLTRRRLFREKSDLLIMQRITGEDALPPSFINKELDADLDAICRRALTRERDARWQTAAAFAEALDAWRAAKRPGDTRAQLQRWIEQHALKLTSGGVPESSQGTVPVRPAPAHVGEGTAAAPSLGIASAETPAPAGPPASAAGEGAELGLPDRSHAEEEPTQRARPPTGRNGENAELDTLIVTEEAPELASAHPAVPSVPRSAPDVTAIAPPPRRAQRPFAALGASAAALGLALVVAIVSSGTPHQQARDETGQMAPARAAGALERSTPPPMPRADAPAPVAVATTEPAAALSARTVVGAPIQLTKGELESLLPEAATVLDEPVGAPAARVEGRPSVRARGRAPGASWRPSPPPSAPAFGSLNMRSTPWVFVKIGREEIGSTTFVNGKVPAGRQTLQLSNPEVGIKETLVVVVPQDRALDVSLEWEKKGNDWRIKSRSIK
jgi:serine/threonine-protein kinase